jgi:hypothetical protein
MDVEYSEMMKYSGVIISNSLRGYLKFVALLPEAGLPRTRGHWFSTGMR